MSEQPINFVMHEVRMGRTGAREDFEQMLGQLVRATEGEGRLVFASPGDWGIDVLVGDLNGRVTVWQAKYFMHGVGRSQRRQITKSFESAVKAAGHGYTLERWVLCVPTSMNTSTTQWWDRWKAEQQRETGITIELWDETGLRELLLKQAADDVRRHYYSHYRDDRAGTPKAAETSAGRSGSFLLPPAPSNFIGRGKELAVLRSSWPASEPDIPVVWAIAGPAGVGKSSLGLHFAHQIATDFRDGQLYVDFRGVDGVTLNAADVLAQFLRVLGVRSDEMPPSVGERASLYRSLLSGRRFLVMLDNADDEGQVRLLLPGSPGCLVLITSRRPLAALDILRPPLVLDMFDERDGVEMLSRLAGAERIQAEPQQATEVVRLCGGLPLALRIVGGRMRTRTQWPIAEVCRRLADERDRLAVLKLGDLDVRASLMLTYRELEPDQALLFRRLGVLHGATFDVVLASAVGAQVVIGGRASAMSTRESTEEFVKHSKAVSAGATALRKYEEAARGRVAAVLEMLADAQLIDAMTPGQYRIHALVRIFAAERLTEDSPDSLEEMIAGINYAEWARTQTGMAIRWANGTSGDLGDQYQYTGFGSEADVDRWLEANRSNLMAAVKMECEADRDDNAVDLAIMIQHLFYSHGYLNDVEIVLDSGLTAARRKHDASSEIFLLARLGRSRLSRRSFPQAIAALEESLLCHPQEQNSEDRVGILTDLANAYICNGQLDKAEERLTDAERLITLTGNPKSWALGTAAIAAQRATLLELKDDAAATMAYFEKALEISRLSDSLAQQAVFLERIGCIYLNQKLVARAIECFEESLEICKEQLFDLRVTTETIFSLARARMMQGGLSRALELLRQALDNFRRLGIPEREAEVLFYQAIAYKRLRMWDEARRCCANALETLDRAGPELQGMREPIEDICEIIQNSHTRQATAVAYRRRTRRK